MAIQDDPSAAQARCTPAQPGIEPGLAALQARLTWELAALQLPAARWTPALQHEGQPVADVVIIGGG
ncbi:MAG: hypothetical protein RJA69_327, partial [Pseudomonadota bacterium]